MYLILFLVLAVIFVEYGSIEPFHGGYRRGGRHGGRYGGDYGGRYDGDYGGRYGGDYSRGYGGRHGGGWNWGMPMWYVYDSPYPTSSYYSRPFFY